MRFEKRVWLASPTMHGDELRYMQEAYETNWMSTVGKNIDEVERQVAEKVGLRRCIWLRGLRVSACSECPRRARVRCTGRRFSAAT